MMISQCRKWLAHSSWGQFPDLCLWTEYDLWNDLWKRLHKTVVLKDRRHREGGKFTCITFPFLILLFLQTFFHVLIFTFGFDIAMLTCPFSLYPLLIIFLFFYFVHSMLSWWPASEMTYLVLLSLCTPVPSKKNRVDLSNRILQAWWHVISEARSWKLGDFHFVLSQITYPGGESSWHVVSTFMKQHYGEVHMARNWAFLWIAYVSKSPWKWISSLDQAFRWGLSSSLQLNCNLIKMFQARTT